MGGSSKKVTVGYKYYVGMHMALCHGPIDKLVRIRVGGKDAWVGGVGHGTISIDRPDLFGGEKREGGVSGLIDIESGAPDQGQNGYLAEKLGSALLPAFRGVCCAVLRQVYMGLNPYLKDWGWFIQRINTRSGGNPQWYSAKASIYCCTFTNIKYVQKDLYSEYNICFVLDRSGSMGTLVASGKTRLDILKERFAEIMGSVAALPGPVRVGVVVFSDSTASYSTSAIVDTMDDAQGLISFVNSFGAAGGTDYGTAMSLAVNFFNANTARDNDVIFITDGEPNPLSSLTNAISIRDNFSRNINIHGVMIYSGSTRYLDQLDNTGGSMIALNDPREIITLVIEILEKFRVFDMNPAHIIRECLTDTNWGMGYPEEDMGDSFVSAADTLFAEGFGLSILWSQQSSLEDFVEDILRHIDAALYVNRATGKFEIKLIRNDYNAASLLVLDRSNIQSVENYTRQTIAELVNEVTVTYPSNETGQDETVTLQNLAMIQQQGSVVSANVDYPAITNSAVAARVAARDLKSLSTPLASATLVANRVAAGLNIGDVFRWNWQETDEDGIGVETSMIMRVTEIAFGDGVNNAVRIQCVQDVFSLPDVVYVSAPKTAWVDPNDPNVLVPLDPNDPNSPLVPNPAATPQPALPRLVWEAPYYDLAFQLGDKGAQAAISGGECFLSVAAGRQGQELNADILVNSGAGYDDGGVLDFCPYAYIRDAWEWNTLDGFVDKPTAMAAAIGRYASLGDEIVWIYHVSAANVVTVRRGCLDTIPRAHAAGTPLIVWHGFSTSDEVEYVNSDEVAVKIITATGVATLSEDAAPADTAIMEQRASRPYPPACVKIAGEWFPTEVLAAETGFNVSWHHRDRLLQTATPTLDTVNASNWYAETDIGPEPGVTYSARLVRRDTEAELDSSTASSGTTVTFTPSYRGEVRLEVWSERDGLRCLHPYSHDFVYTGTMYKTDSTTPISGNLLEGTTGFTISQVNSDPLNVGIDVAGSNGGTFTITSSGSWTFDPDGDFAALTGSDTATTSVTYHASDGVGEAMGTLTVTVGQLLWTPAEITTALWLDAADSSTITLNGSTVSKWWDKSGNARHATQGTAGAQPTLETNRLSFDGGDHLSVADVAGLQFGTGDFAAIVVANITNVNRVQGSQDTLVSKDYIGFELYIYQGIVAGYIGGTADANISGATSGAWDIFSQIRMSSAHTVRRTGTPSSSATNTGNVSQIGTNVFIGHCPGLPEDCGLIGKISEIILLPAGFTATDLQRIEGYLAHKWDALLGVATLVSALPSDHPYKSTPPAI